MALRSKAEIERMMKVCQQRCELGASLYGPMKRIRGRSESAAKSRFAATLATGHAAEALAWVLKRESSFETDAERQARRERTGDFE